MLVRSSLRPCPYLRQAFESITAAILARLSRNRDLPSGGTSATEPLKVLQREYPNLRELIGAKSVLDFGCGHGEQSAALATVYGCQVTGLDNNPRVLNEARARRGDRVRFIEQIDGQQYDVVVSQNSFEHFSDPSAVLDTMLAALRPGGLILITFGPPWFAPFGSHMHFFCGLPWLNLLFPERAVMKVRAQYWQDGAARYEDVEGGLNRMSLAKFERLTDRGDIRLESRRYTAIKRLNALTSIPVLRELMTNHCTVVVRKAVS